MQLAYARSVIVVPGYGMAVAQAQHPVRELAELIEKRGGEVKYAIHPVAGRMPGHMNVLLAEANVPYDRLYDMDEINHEFARADVALVIGANDVVNPAARNDPTSPIHGMPILNVDQAQRVIVLKRSMNPGFAGHRERAVLQVEHGHAVRRRQDLAHAARGRGQDGDAPRGRRQGCPFTLIKIRRSRVVRREQFEPREFELKMWPSRVTSVSRKISSVMSMRKARL